ncbi:MAG: HEPN domain-containing protein [candidate division WOR-3 bacterium]
MKKSMGEKWFELAEYDLSVAEGLLGLGYYAYCVFMCHLSIEKALKGLFQERTGEYPPKLHNLLYFVKNLSLEMPQDLLHFLGKINDAHILTRYPEELAEIKKNYKRKAAENYLANTRRVLEWIKTNLKK